MMTTEGPSHQKAVMNKEKSLKDLIIAIRDWLNYFLANWLIILLFIVLGISIGITYAILRKPVYTATTTFVLEDEKTSGGLGSLAGLASIAGFDLGGSGGGLFQGDNIFGLYKSRMMIEQTLLNPIRLNGAPTRLIDRYLDFNNLREKWKVDDQLFKSTIDMVDTNRNAAVRDSHIRLRDSILGVIVNDINKNSLSVIKPDKKLSTIQVDVKSKDEVFAKSFNDELVKNVNEFYIKTKTKKNIQNVNILQYKTDSVRSVMNGAIYSAVAIADATPNLNPTRQIQRTAPAQKAQFSAESNKVVLGELVKNLELSKMSLLKETPLIQVIDSPILPLKNDKLGLVKSAFNGAFVLGIMAILYLAIRRIYQLAMA